MYSDMTNTGDVSMCWQETDACDILALGDKLCQDKHAKKRKWNISCNASRNKPTFKAKGLSIRQISRLTGHALLLLENVNNT